MSIDPGSPQTDGWYGVGSTPAVGERYEFEDFVGARFVGTVASWFVSRGFLRLEFSDRETFETNLPVRFRDA